MPRISQRNWWRIVALPLLVLAGLHYLDLVPSRVGPWLVDPALANAKSVLWVTAHPDDESFFFAPSLANLLSAGRDASGHLLCLSVGNHEGLGSTRRRELEASCAALRIPAERCVALDHPELPDSPDLWWPESTIARVVQLYVDKWDIDVVITFDGYGVSGHANHRALASGLGQTARTNTTFPPTFAVQSTNVLLKYTSLATLPITLLRHALQRLGVASGVLSQPAASLFLSSPAQYLQARRSFDQHVSQWRWFRTLFVTFSRYLWFIELARVE